MKRAIRVSHIVLSTRDLADLMLEQLKTCESRDLMFKMFARLHDQSRYPGTGMGLAICKRIITEHGGEIWIEPNAGGGSRFRFSLPA